jgi:sirohydrochlorin ferrochelatase
MSSYESAAAAADVGLLLVGHGTREPAGVDEFMTIARLISDRFPQGPVEPSFLEFATPAIADGVARLAEQGVRRVVVAPVILFAARHIRRDIPAAVARAAASYPQLQVTQAEHLGCHDALVRLSEQRYDEAIVGQGSVAPERTWLVLVGRGSHDSAAREEMMQFAAARHSPARASAVRVAFLAMATPTLANVLEDAARSGMQRIVVQPHLLFAGELLARLHGAVAHSQAHWLTTGHLGPSELVAEAVLERVAQSLAR